jgi:hypothetical protein
MEPKLHYSGKLGWVKTRAAHKCPIDIRLSHELGDIGGFNASPVLQAHRLRSL